MADSKLYKGAQLINPANEAIVGDIISDAEVDTKISLIALGDTNIIEGVIVDGVTLTPDGNKKVTIPVANDGVGTESDGLITHEEKTKLNDIDTTLYALNKTAFETVATSTTLIQTLSSKVLYCIHATTDIELTIPTNATQSIAIGSEFIFVQFGVANVILQVGANVTVNRVVAGAYQLNGIDEVVILKKIATDEWSLLGSYFEVV